MERSKCQWFPSFIVNSVDVSDIFYFSARGSGEGPPRRREGGRGDVFFENPRRGGVSQEKGRGGEEPGGYLRGIRGGGGAKYFFGAEIPTK